MFQVLASDTGLEAGLAFGRRLVLRFADFVEQHQKLVLSLYSVLFILVTEFRSASKLLWYDELASYLPAKLSMAGLWAFFREGLDVHPPLTSLLVKGVIAAVGDNLLTIRLPFILSYLVMCLCIYRFVSRRCPGVYALAAMVFPTIAATYYYATEIRGYAVLLGMTGVALLCWQSASDSRRRIVSVVGLFLSLSLCICSHYYALFVWIPLGLAELTRIWDRRKVDWPVCLALTLSTWPLLLFLPSIRAAREAYAATVWNKPSISLSEVGDTYGALLNLSFMPLVGAIALWLVLSRLGPLPDSKPVDVPRAERVLIGTLALLPVFALPLSLLAGAYLSRYVLPSIIGIAIFFAFGLARALGRDRLVGSILAVVFLCWFCLKNEKVVLAGIRMRGAASASIDSYRQQAWMRELAGNNLPIAATNTPFFLQVQFYAPPAIRSRVVYPVSRKYAMEFDGSDTGDNNMVHFSRRLSIPLADYDAFVAENPHFMLCADTTWPTWLIEKLLQDGARLRLLKREGTVFVYDVYYRGGVAAFDHDHK